MLCNYDIAFSSNKYNIYTAVTWDYTLFMYTLTTILLADKRAVNAALISRIKAR